MTEIIDKVKEREHWVNLLQTTWMYHQQKVKDKQSPILGAQPDDEVLLHQAMSVAILDCIELIQQLEAYGYFEDEEELPQHSAGPLG